MILLQLGVQNSDTRLDEERCTITQAPLQAPKIHFWCAAITHLEHNYSSVSSRRGGRNKLEDWQISAKVTNREDAMGRLANFSKVHKRGGWQKQSDWKFHWNKIIKRSCENINKNNIRNTKVAYSTWRITCSFAWFSSTRYMSIIYLAAFYWRIPRKMFCNT